MVYLGLYGWRDCTGCLPVYRVHFTSNKVQCASENRTEPSLMYVRGWTALSQHRAQPNRGNGRHLSSMNRSAMNQIVRVIDRSFDRECLPHGALIDRLQFM